MTSNTAETRALSSVFIGNVPIDILEEQLKDLFSECGQVVNFKLFCDKAGKSQGFAFCEYKEPEIAVSATRNLGGYNLKGQPLRVDIATSEKCRQELERLQGSIDSSEVSEGTAEKAPEEISKAVASLPAEQMFELMKQMKMCIENNPQEARNLLLQNPQLAYALLQAQVIMRIVDPEVAVKILDRTTGPGGVESDKPNPEQTAGSQVVGENTSAFMPRMPSVNPDPIVAPTIPQMPPPLPTLRPPVMPRQMMALNLFPDQDLRTAGDQDLRQLPPPIADRDLRTQPPIATDKDFRIPMGDQDFRTLPSATTAPESRPFDPRFRNMPAPDIPRPVAPPFGRAGNIDPRTVYEARNVSAPVRVEDPRRASMSAALNSRLSAAGSALQNLGPAMLPLGAIPGAASMLPEDQEKAALIMQVLQLTEQQIAQLPPEQRTSIMVLKDQLARSQLI